MKDAEKDTTVSLAELCLKHRKAGIKEVVEWHREFIYSKQNGICIMIPPATYEAKLKEWGVE